MKHNQWLLLQRTIDLAQDGFQKSSIHRIIGWVVPYRNQILAEGWCLSEKDFKNQIEDYFSNEEASNSPSLYLSANPFGEIEQLRKFAAKYAVDNFYLACEADQELRYQEWFTNRRWCTYFQEKRPYIVLKWAQTSDGFIARSNFDSKWISSPHARKLVHRWRSQEAAIWVGKNTYRYDDPRLNVRDWVGENPIRIVVDRERSLSDKLNIFDHSQPTLCYTHHPPETSTHHLEYVALPNNDNWEQVISFVFSDLYQREITSVFVEGGSQLLSFLIEHHWWDEARVFTSETTFEHGIKAQIIEEDYKVEEKFVGPDRLTTYLKAKQKVKE